MSESRPDPNYDHPDLLVIGMGDSGGAAGNAADDGAADVFSLDDTYKMLRIGPGFRNWINRFGGYFARVWAVWPDGSVTFSDPSGTKTVSPRSIIIATGATDIPLPVPGWQLPQVVGAARTYRTLAQGTDVIVLRGPHAGTGGREPDLDRFKVLDTLDISDDPDLRIEQHGAGLRIIVAGRTIAAPAIVLDNGLQTENTLARSAGIPSLFCPLAGGDVIDPGTVFALGGTLVSVVGDAAGIGSDWDAMIAEAEETGRSLAMAVGTGEIPRTINRARPPWPKEGTPTLPACTTDDTLVCPDEGVTVGDVREAIRRGATTVNDVKRRTRAAMAACQGRDCLFTIRALLAEAGQDFATPMTARAPITAITLAELASLADTRPRDAIPT